MQKRGQFSLTIYKAERQQKLANIMTLLNYINEQRAVEEEAKREAEKLAWEREKAYLPYLYPKASDLIEYEYGPTPYEQALLKLREKELANDMAIARLRAAQSRASSGTRIPSTAGERKNLATSTLLNAAINRYDELRKAGYQYPLYYTINSMLRDPEWVSATTESGADLKSAIDAVIRIKGKMTPEEYFNTPTGSKLRKYYFYYLK